MTLFPLFKLVPVLAVISTLTGTASADDAGPLQKQLTSSFTGFDWSIKNIPLDADFVTAMQKSNPSVRLKKKRWASRDIASITPPHDEYEGTNFGVSNIQGVNDRTVVAPTHWHTGGMIWKVERTVKSSKAELMPTAADLAASTIAAFGPDPVTDSRTYGAGGMGQQSFQMLAYPVKDGARHEGPCFNIDMRFGNMTAGITERYNAAQKVIADIENGQHCDAVVMVLYSEGRMNRLREYRIVARDFLMEAKNHMHDVDTRERLQQQHQNSLPTVAPKL